MKSKVSIIVPCYNQAQYLEEALQSVLEQSFLNWECIIVNDGSPDHTEEIAKEWTNKDLRFKYLFQENAGVCNARNFGINHAAGEFVLPLDADDKISSDYVALALNAFREDTSLKVVYCKVEKFGDELGVSQLEEFSLFNLSRKNMIFCTAMFRKDEWKRVGGYDLNMTHGIEDWEFWIAILKNGGGVKCLDIIGFYYRIKRESRQTQISSENYKNLFEYMSVKHADFFVQQYGSFKHMQMALEQKTAEYEYKLKSKKFAIDVFCSVFFGFSIFGKYRKVP